MSINVERLMEIVEDCGLEATLQSAYSKVSVGSRAVYIANTKKVSRVDFSGFDFDHPAVIKLSESEARALKLGKVRAQLDFGKSDERVLEAFRTGIEMMKHLAATPEEEEEKVTAKPTPMTSRKAVNRKAARATSAQAKKSKSRTEHRPNH